MFHVSRFTFQEKGFTLLEVVVYVGMLVIVFSAVSGLLFWTIRSQAQEKVIREVLMNAERSMATIQHKTREAKSVYTPTSVFDAHPGQLSLEVYADGPTEHIISYVDFFVCGTRLCIKREGEEPVAITSERVRVSNLVFRYIGLGSATPSVRIEMTVEYEAPSGKAEYEIAMPITSTATLREN